METPESIARPSAARPCDARRGRATTFRFLRAFQGPLLAALVGAGTLIGCGLEPDGSHKSAPSNGANVSSASADAVGRYRSESIRLGVTRPLFLLIDTATGLVLERPILGAQKFRPVGTDPAPGANLDPLVNERFDVKIVPGRRGSALLRLDTATGAAWFYQLSAKQAAWQVLPSTLDEELKKPSADTDDADANGEAASGSLSSTGPAALQVGRAAPESRPPIEAMIEVLTEPGFEPELRVWTADHMAGIYPVEAAELLSVKLQTADRRVMLAIIEKVALDSEGQVRAALEKLKGHADKKVAAAVNEKLK